MARARYSRVRDATNVHSQDEALAAAWPMYSASIRAAQNGV